MPNIRVIDKNGQLKAEFTQHPGEMLAAALKRNGFSPSMPCGGRGTCGKCRYRVVKGAPVFSSIERQLLTREELDGGVRLLCASTFLSDGTIMLLEEEGQIESVGVISAAGVAPEARRTMVAPHEGKGEAPEFDVAADIGTTTIALALRDRVTGDVLASYTFNNSQRSYGADVLSRIEAANTGMGEELQKLIWQDVEHGIDHLFAAIGRAGRIGSLVISANTTMQHLFFGDSCEHLGTAPFTPVSLELRQKKSCEIFAGVREEYADIEVVLLPGISAFVGADILSGMYERRMLASRKPVLLLDLGTNGEMVLKTNQEFLATSASAGPALEGGNISCGVPGVAGAISSVSMMGNRLVVHTIQNKRPIGLCGTGVMELVYELRKMGVIDNAGTFTEKYRGCGFPVTDQAVSGTILFTQQDMRQLQMAKAAIRSGIELLLKEARLRPEDIDKVYLAGGLGYKLNAYKAAGIGLLPLALRDKTVAVGNTSLLGALRFLEEKDGALKMKELRRLTKEMSLAAHPDFENYYYRYMNF